MDLNYVVDSGCTRCALPKNIFKELKPHRTTTLTSSSGCDEAPIYKCNLPRLQPGAAAAETREVIGINGPPCLSLGMQVETSEGPAGFWYGKDWQGFVWGANHVNKIDHIVNAADCAEQVTRTPADNYIPYYNPGLDDDRKREVDLAVMMLDPEVREQVELIEEIFDDPEMYETLCMLLEANDIVDEVEDVLSLTKEISDALKGDSALQIHDAVDSVLAAGEKRGKTETEPRKKTNIEGELDIEMTRRKVTASVKDAHATTSDTLIGVGKLDVIHERAKSEVVKHDAIRRHAPGEKCEQAACVAGAMKDVAHRRSEREKQPHTWHTDMI